MSYAEILSHSLPFLEAISSEINRIRIIEAGGNPDRDDEKGSENHSPSNSGKKALSGESDALFYGRLNDLLR